MRAFLQKAQPARFLPYRRCLFPFSVNYGKKVNELYKAEGQTSFANLPDKDHFQVDYLERNEIEARIMRILSYFEKVDLRSFKWTDDFEKDLKMDSLDQTALLTSIEDEFTFVFEDRVFDNFRNLEDVIRYLVRDPMTI